MIRPLKPSNAVAKGTVSGAALGPLVLWVLSLIGAPLPSDPAQAAALGSALGGLLAGLVGYGVRGGRAGEAD